MNEERMVSILSDNDEEAVSRAESLLRDAGIGYSVRPRGTFLGSTEIFVRASDVQAARDVLAELRSAPSRRPPIIRILALALLLAVVLLYGYFLLRLYR